jgi:hypothetical protein
MNPERRSFKSGEKYNLNGQLIDVLSDVTLPELFRLLEFNGAETVALYWTRGPNSFSTLGIVTNRVTHIVSDGRLEHLEKEGLFQPLFPEATYIAHLGEGEQEPIRLMTTLLPEEVKKVAETTGFDPTKLKFQHALNESMC